MYGRLMIYRQLFLNSAQYWDEWSVSRPDRDIYISLDAMARFFCRWI